MKKLFLATVALAALGTATSASAADLARRTYTKAPPMIAAVYDWSGFYIGGNGGYGSASKCWDFIPSTVAGVPTGAANVGEGCHDADGGTAGGQIGYRWQNASWVYGLEAQGNWADFKGRNVSTPFPLIANRSKIDAFGLFTGQIGYAWNNTLLYVKGGAAVVNENYSSVANATGLLLATASSNTRWGGVIGVGLEYGFTPNWSFAVAYDHIFLDGRDARFTTPAGVFYANDRISGDVDLVTARINYRWGGPAVGRY
ncbi:MAG: outer membrane beta-barrel protein [Tardiphaga sp.]|uniref:outer membrane protein n=1 Tax=Tardiphaga sp. TaxID=1926292 RepID=UPI0019AEA4BB|nr:outer membrane beta-barrel protein [Tardiphaga sp.]MBC7585418.1 outer membrane beta-barrel protein [Tardiphaga sp.]